MLLTGTFGQYKALVPSVENGYFSRLLTVVIKGTNGFDKRYVKSQGTQSVVPKMVGQRLLRTYEALIASEEREWSLTEEQKERLGEHLEAEYATLIGLLGENFHSAVIRMAVQIERIAMILSTLRAGEKLSVVSNQYSDFICSDEDYQTAEMIGNKMLLHMAAAYRMIDGDAQDVVPEIKPLDQRKVLFEALPAEYASKKLEEEARLQGVSRATSMRWNEEWQHQGLIQKIRYGVYRKTA